MIDGFSYPSIKTQQNLGFDICFSAEKARENLNFCGLMVCQLGPPSTNSAFQFLPIYDGFLNNDGEKILKFCLDQRHGAVSFDHISSINSKTC
jgi:hypothetical protein